MTDNKAREIAMHKSMIRWCREKGSSIVAEHIESQRAAIADKDAEIERLNTDLAIAEEKIETLDRDYGKQIDQLQARVKELEEFRRIVIQGWQPDFQEWIDDGEPEEDPDDIKLVEKMIEEQMCLWHPDRKLID